MQQRLSPLRRPPEWLPGSSTSALFAYLTAGSESAVGDPLDFLSGANIFIDDTPVAERMALGRSEAGGQYVDISSQDGALAVGAFAIQRLGDGQVEHRGERSFRYGGVIECADGFVELLTLEQRQ